MKNRRGESETRRHDDKSSLRVAASPRRRVPLITLLTDFGTKDYFVGAVKSVILGRNPQARIVDITHDIPPQDIEAGAFTLLAAYSSFPAGAIHLAVVDPGVGSARRAIVIKFGRQFFVGPDNGIFSYVCDRGEGGSFKVFELTNKKYFRQPVSPTFHGRDVFGPAAAALSLGVKPTELGTEIKDFVRLPPLHPETSAAGKLLARIIHIDRFGNCVTNITPNDLTARMIAGGATLRVRGKSVKSFRTHFAEKTAGREKLFAIWGSAGFLELAVANDSAAELLGAKRGDAVVSEVRRTSVCRS